MNTLLKKTLTPVVLLVALVATAVPLPPIAIKATKKTADVQRDSERVGPRVTRTHATKEQYYQIELSTMTPGLPDYVVVRWVVLLDDFKGRLVVGTRGSKDLPLAVNKVAEVQTDSFALESNTLNKINRGGHEREMSIRGYGIRVCDDTGKILAEKFDPPSAEKDLLEAFEERPAKTRE